VAKEFKSFTLVPKQGRGIVTSRSPQVLAEYTDSLAYLSNFLAKDGAWVCRSEDLFTTLILSANGPVYGIHYYNAIDPSNAAATPTTTYLIHAGQARNETGTSTLYRSDTAAAVTVNGVNFTTTTPSDIFFLNIKNRCFVAGTKMGTNVVPTVVTRYPSAASYMWGVNAPTADLFYDAYTNVTNTTTKVFWQSAGVTVTNGSSNAVRAAGTWDTTNWDGKTAVINGVPYDIVDVIDANNMTISPAWVNDGSGSPATVGLRIQYGEISWPDIGPSYAYAYYNPTTGHISSVSPVLTISEPTISDVRVKLSGIQLTNDPNYTRVVIFRTAFDTGGNLLPLKLNPSHGGTATIDNTVGSAGRYMIENTSTGTVTYVDFVSAGLGAILGPVQAPLQNDPPPPDIRYMAFWDQRVWVVPASARYRLQFSGNASQIELGVPEESFPANNFRDVSSDDGFITGLKVVGTSLLVCTERYLYFVSGGSSAADYRLERISTRGSGVDQYAIDEHPGDSSTQSASVIYVSRDKRLWRQYPGGRVEDFGWPIQDKLDTINLNLKKPVILRVAQVGKSWLLVLAIRELATPRYGYLFYDFDEQVWLDLNLGTPAMWGSGYGGYAINMWSGIGAGVVYDALSSGQSVLDIGSDRLGGVQRIRLMGSDSGGFFCYLNTQFLDCGDKQAKKGFQEFIVHTDEPTASLWEAVAQFDDGGTIYTLTAVPGTDAATTPRYMGREVIRYVLPSTAPPQFHTTKLAIKGTLQKGNSVFKIVLNYTIESTGISGSVT
jgi:hypothetical protein